MTFGSYAYLIRRMIVGGVRLYPLTWFLWGFVALIVYLSQMLDNAGRGAHASLLTCLFLLLIATMSLVRGYKMTWRQKDTFILVFSLAAVALWFFLDNPIYSVLVLIFIEFTAFVPTFVKGVKDPISESAFFYFLASLKYFSSLFSFDAYTTSSVLYPVFAVICYFSFSVMLFCLRRKLVRTDDSG